mgnify:CR=1 FL=1
MERKLKDYAVLMLKGMGMGAADVVPGVSGGTIAFIVGIYDELINSIKSINLESLKLFFSGKWAAFWKKINGNFLFFLLAGIGISVFSLAKLITWLLVDQPILVWSFFFRTGAGVYLVCIERHQGIGRAGKRGWLLLLGQWLPFILP